MSRRSPLLFAQGPRLPSDVSFRCIRRSGKKLLLRLDNAGRRDVFKSVSRVGEVIQISRGRGRVFSCLVFMVAGSDYQVFGASVGLGASARWALDITRLP